MGTGKQSRKKKAANNGARHVKTKFYKKDVDQIHAEKKKRKPTYMDNGIQRTLPDVSDGFGDPDLPAGGAFYCVETDRHFITAEALEAHKKTKGYKRRVKELEKEPYTQKEADWAAGMTAGPDNGKRGA
eukprot:TRINITY_DN18194_c0_g1_i2.p1 TRINITY_DN18194_c0_g1~~TRINITY_DN18194_c0_g1_i2.p1  ORF type:complete len:129 (-),score=42.56 TRINITY_DN18194_c0_g1_i2:552-938(-)